MKLEDVTLGVSPLTDEIYMGTISKKDAGLWLSKRPAVSDFCRALFTWIPAGTTRTIRSSAGPWYEVEVREIEPQEGVFRGLKRDEGPTADAATGTGNTQGTEP